MIRQCSLAIMILLLFPQIIFSQDVSDDSTDANKLSRGGMIWLKTCSPDTASPRMCIYGTDLPESCSTTNRSLGIVIKWYDGVVGWSYERLVDSLVESALNSYNESDPNIATIHDTTVGRYRTILRISYACSPPCMLIDRIGLRKNKVVYIMATYPLLDETQTSCYRPMLEMVKLICDGPFKREKKQPSPSLEVVRNRIILRR